MLPKLPKNVLRLLNEIYVEEKCAEVRVVLRKKPEKLLISLLTRIVERLPEVSATLAITVEQAASYVLEIGEELLEKEERAKK